MVDGDGQDQTTAPQDGSAVDALFATLQTLKSQLDSALVVTGDSQALLQSKFDAGVAQGRADQKAEDDAASQPPPATGGFSQADLDAAKAQGAADQKAEDDAATAQKVSDLKTAAKAAIDKVVADEQADGEAQKAAIDAL